MVAGGAVGVALPLRVEDEGGGFSVYDRRGQFVGWFSDQAELALYRRRLRFNARVLARIRQGDGTTDDLY